MNNYLIINGLFEHDVPENMWYCPRCFSTDVEIKCFVRVNETGLTGNYTIPDEIEENDCWCCNCQTQSILKYKWENE